jgi:hypothetical protein
VTIAIADTTGATLPSAKTEIHKTTIAKQTTIVAVLMVAAEGPGCLIPNVPCTPAITTSTIQKQIVSLNPELKTDYSRPNSRVPSKCRCSKSNTKKCFNRSSSSSNKISH